jgi:predicted nuclease of predicted toxin-antitoxin system
MIPGSDPPPQVLWVRVGNVTNREFFAATLQRALELLRAGEPLVEMQGEAR